MFINLANRLNPGLDYMKQVSFVTFVRFNTKGKVKEI